MGRLDGKVAIITGGTSGIGRRTVERFVAEGASVVFTGRQAAKGADLERAMGESAVFVEANAALEEDTVRVVQTAVDRFGRVDVAFHNAGHPGVTGSIAKTDTTRFDETVAVLFRAVMLGMKHVAPVMRAQGSGSIINNASIAGSRTGHGPHVYSACKAAVIHLTKSVATELGRHAIRVNSVSPGFIATPIFGRSMGLSADEAEAKLHELSETAGGRAPISRPGVPDDIASAVVFLGSDESTYINGVDLVIDGGLTTGTGWEESLEAMGNIAQALRG